MPDVHLCMEHRAAILAESSTAFRVFFVFAYPVLRLSDAPLGLFSLPRWLPRVLLQVLALVVYLNGRYDAGFLLDFSCWDPGSQLASCIPEKPCTLSLSQGAASCMP